MLSLSYQQNHQSRFWSTRRFINSTSIRRLLPIFLYICKHVARDMDGHTDMNTDIALFMYRYTDIRNSMLYMCASLCVSSIVVITAAGVVVYCVPAAAVSCWRLTADLRRHVNTVITRQLNLGMFHHKLYNIPDVCYLCEIVQLKSAVVTCSDLQFCSLITSYVQFLAKRCNSAQTLATVIICRLSVCCHRDTSVL